MPHRPAKRGDNFFDHMTSSVYNELIRNLPSEKTRNLIRTQGADSGLIHVVNTRATPVDWLEPIVTTGSTKITPGTSAGDTKKLNKVINVKAPTDGDSKLWFISQQCLIKDRVGVAMASGVTWAKFTQTDTGHTHVTLDASGQLVSGFTGRGRIIIPASSSTGWYGLILLESYKKPEKDMGSVLYTLSWNSSNNRWESAGPTGNPDAVNVNWDVGSAELEILSTSYRRYTLTTSIAVPDNPPSGWSGTPAVPLRHFEVASKCFPFNTGTPGSIPVQLGMNTDCGVLYAPGGGNSSQKIHVAQWVDIHNTPSAIQRSVHFETTGLYKYIKTDLTVHSTFNFGWGINDGKMLIEVLTERDFP